jgi:hypothetical protein
MSNTNCQTIEISVELGRVVTTLNIIKHILCSVLCVHFFFIYYGPCRKIIVEKGKLSIVC